MLVKSSYMEVEPWGNQMDSTRRDFIRVEVTPCRGHGPMDNAGYKAVCT